jgi:hypothetical protein
VAKTDIGTAIVAGLVVGLICGLLPLITGLVKGRRELAIVGFITTAVGGLILGILLALPIAIGFTLAIFFWKPGRRDRHVTTA